MEWALVAGLRSLPLESGQRGICPGCSGEVQAVAVTSELVAPHWRHLVADCDPWSEPESEWHRNWKARFPVEWQEVTKGAHRADVAGPDGVLEIQRSSISIEEVREREQFYGRMCWLLNGHDFWENIVWLEVRGEQFNFRWKHARKTWLLAKRPLLIDTPMGLLRVTKLRKGAWTVIEGRFVGAAAIMEFLDRSKSFAPTQGWRDQEIAFDEFRQTLLNQLTKIDKVTLALENLTRWEPWYSAGLPPERPGWMRGDVGVCQWLFLHCLLAEEEIQRWEGLAIEAAKEQTFREERAAQLLQQSRLEEEQRQIARLQAEREQQLRMLELSRASQESYKRERVRIAEEKRREELLIAGRIRAANLLEQAQPLALEWHREDIIKQFLACREAPPHGFGVFETEFIQSCVKSLQAAAQRGNITT